MQPLRYPWGDLLFGLYTAALAAAGIIPLLPRCPMNEFPDSVCASPEDVFTPEQLAEQERARQAFLDSPEGQAQQRRQRLMNARQDCTGDGIQAAAAERWPALCLDCGTEALLRFAAALRECGRASMAEERLAVDDRPAARVLLEAIRGDFSTLRPMVDQLEKADYEQLQELLDLVIKGE